MNDNNQLKPKSKVMKSGRAFWGTFFLSLGLFFLIHRMFDPDISVEWVLTLWPILIILIGIAIILKNHYTKLVLSCLSALVLALLIYASAATIQHGCSSIKVHHRDHLSGTVVNHYKLAADSTIKKIALNYEFGGGSLMVFDDSTEFISLKTNNENFDFKVNEKRNDSLQKVRLWLDDAKFDLFDIEDLKVDLGLNKEPVYDLHFEMGALSADMDLSELKIERLDLQTGASALEIKLGMPVLKKSVVDVEMGAAGLELFIPKEAAAVIHTDIALSSQSYTGFRKVKSNRYESENFSTSEYYYVIKLQGGVASFKVTRY